MSLGILVNGSYTGGMGMLARREVDMLMGPIAQHPTRSELVEYAQAYLYNPHAFLYKRITQVQPDVLIFTKPFVKEFSSGFGWVIHWVESGEVTVIVWVNEVFIVADVALYGVGVFNVWLWVLASMVAVGGTAGLLHLVHSSRRVIPSKSGQSKWVMISRGFTWAWKLLLAQDVSDTPREGAGRTLCVFWLFVCFMITSMYRSNITAILINDKVKLPFTSVEEFEAQNIYKLTWINGQIYNTYFQNYALTQPDYVLGKMWKKRTEYQPDAKNVITTVLKDEVAA
ncbi:uncharacterized protein LOC125177979 [Hyalella azteca]|uniref:Uncharacterized protein LOC125177979 n=1 Tax=Hyalella azteca TaxID=294128 RepID=A0A979FKC9_HYAAZ|nr:uncharacterized protein LOC125177979 [Hyalella azteca]